MKGKKMKKYSAKKVHDGTLPIAQRCAAWPDEGHCRKQATGQGRFAGLCKDHQPDAETRQFPVNDPQIAAAESKAARRERGYLAGEKASGIEDIRNTPASNLCRKCGQPKEPSRPGSRLCRSCDHGGDGRKPTDAQYRTAAKKLFEREGEIEIDINAIVSRGDDPGAYVAAWVWVPRDEAGGISPCPSTGVGTDGTGKHHGELTAIRFRERNIQVCANHIDGYMKLGWRNGDL